MLANIHARNRPGRAGETAELSSAPLPAPLSAARFIDVHYHADPDAYVRRHGALEAGGLYAEYGGWVVLKNHLGCTAAQSVEARRAGLPLSGSLVLNEIAGGIDWRVVERSLCQAGCQRGGQRGGQTGQQTGAGEARFIVHLPTVTGHPHRSRLSREPANPILSRAPIRPLRVSGEDGALLPETLDVMRLCRDHPLVLSTGHADKEDVYRLIDAALALGVPRLMLNQPASPMTGFSARELIELGAEPSLYIEQCALTYLLGYQSEEDFGAALTGISNLVYSSDLGQPSQPDIEEWLALTEVWFRKFGLTDERIDEITRANPLAMLT
ncbi:DUF6282 family protein [Breoghania sp. JC706]|uniref:DUF6282 family protein n=1 Tax=Breoghania sp. JC706 TaxID=3117732 RepID=UPI00300B69F8